MHGHTANVTEKTVDSDWPSKNLTGGSKQVGQVELNAGSGSRDYPTSTKNGRSRIKPIPIFVPLRSPIRL